MDNLWSCIDRIIDLLNWIILVLTGFWTMSELTDLQKSHGPEN